MWAVHVRYEKERDGHHKRQNQYQDAFGFNSSCTIADQQVGARARLDLWQSVWEQRR
jgi:hypothetical protein